MELPFYGIWRRAYTPPMRMPLLPLLLALALPAPAYAAAPADGDKATEEKAPAEGEAPADGGEVAPAPKPREAFDARLLEQRDAELLAASATPEDEAVWLEADGGKFLALFQPAAAAEAKGAVLILHDSGETPLWPEAVESIRRGLAAQGWHTLAVALPAPAPPPVPVRTLPVISDAPPPAEGDAAAAAEAAPAEGEAPAAKDAAAEGAEAAATDAAPAADNAPAAPPTPTPEQVEAQADARLEAAWALMKSRDYRNVALVGAGSGASRALRLASRHTIAPNNSEPYLSAIVMLSAREEARPLLQAFKDSPLPILDINQTPSETQRAEMQRRQRQAQRLNLGAYDQVELQPQRHNFSGDEDALAKRVRGWLMRATASFRAFDAKERAKPGAP